MKRINLLVVVALIITTATAQFRPTDRTGINVFETPKTETQFDGVNVKIGGGFTQGFQALKHSNSVGNPNDPSIQLVSLRPGFNLASANLMLKTQLADGVALNMELYLASRHHNETWVKGGYIQFDKAPFLDIDIVNNIMKYTTLKVGQMEVNYGDAHFRRTDGGNAIYNPFMENNIIDAFATEIGFEADVQHNGLLGVLSVTSGLLKGNIIDVAPTAVSDGVNNPSIIAKAGYDKQLTDDLRLRITGSVYHNPGTAGGNTLLAGDRTGSNYFGVMHQDPPTTANATTGRYTPGFSDKITGLMGNVLVKYHGLEWFNTVELLSGRNKTETTGDRKATQLATDLIYRFGNNENFWVGARYNTVGAEQYLANALPAEGNFAAVDAGMYDVNISRLAFSAGWFLTDNVMMKAEYVKQDYKGFLYNNINSNGNFNGLVIQAVVGF